MSILEDFINFSEVWSLFIPIIALYRNRKQPAYLKPVIYYIFIALVINFLGDIMYFAEELKFPIWFQTNTYLYQIHSIIRLLLFSIFFIRLKQPFLVNLKKAIPILFIVFVIINFRYSDQFFNYYYDNVKHFVQSKLSNHLLAVEAVLLLLYCLIYYLFRLQDEHEEKRKPAHFWVVTGLCIFIVPCIPIYIFYDNVLKVDVHFAMYIWKVIDICYLIFCIMIAKAFSSSKYD